MPFDLHAKNHFLTYPQCYLHPDYVCQYLVDLIGPERLLYVGVAQEAHEDGSWHLHAVVCYKEKRRIRSETYYDIAFGGEEWHGRYEACRSLQDSLAYIKKDDGEYARWGTSPTKAKSSYALALHTAKSKKEFLEFLLEAAPRDAVLYHNAIDSFAERRFGDSPGFEPVRSLDEFNVPTVLNDWMNENLVRLPILTLTTLTLTN